MVAVSAGELLIVHTDADGVDVGVLGRSSLNVAFGDDENDFELKCPSGTSIEAGSYVYVEGTEWGGVVDAANPDTASGTVKYTGRSWHGILSGKVLLPPQGSDHMVLEGDANACLAEIVEATGVGALFSVPEEPSGIAVDYEVPRFADAWSAVVRMLASANATPMLSFDGSHVTLWAEEAYDGSGEEWDADKADVSMKISYRPVNHLVCAGEGELGDRVVVHLYADEDGNVSRTQSLFGIDEVAELYDFTLADEAQLIEDGTERLAGMQDADTCSVTVNEGGYRINDTVIANDPSTGCSVTARVSKIIADVKDGYASLSYKAGDVLVSSPSAFSRRIATRSARR